MEIWLVILFIAGMFIQAMLLLLGRRQEGDLRSILIAFGTGFLGMLPGKSEENYDLGLHLFISCVIAAGTFTYWFRKRLLARVGARTLLIWNSLFIFVIFNHFGYSDWLLALIFIPTALTFINGFTNMDKRFGWQVFFYAWFSAMVAILGIFQFAFKNLKILFMRGELGSWLGLNEVPSVSSIEVILTGAAFLYLVSSLWYVLALIPIPLHKRQTHAQRMIQVREHMQLLAYGYIWQKDDVIGNFFCVIVFPVLLFINYTYPLISENMIIVLVFVFLPLLERLKNQGQYEFELHDGVGSTDKFSGYARSE